MGDPAPLPRERLSVEGDSAQRFGLTYPDEPQGVQSEGRLLEGSRQFRLLVLGQPDFLRTNVIVHLREGLQALYLVAEQVIHFIQGRLT